MSICVISENTSSFEETGKEPGIPLAAVGLPRSGVERVPDAARHGHHVSERALLQGVDTKRAADLPRCSTPLGRGHAAPGTVPQRALHHWLRLIFVLFSMQPSFYSGFTILKNFAIVPYIIFFHLKCPFLWLISFLLKLL